MGVQTSDAAHLRARETQLAREVQQLREAQKSAEDELHRIQAQYSVDSYQMKELQDQYETEHYFSVKFIFIYKNQ